MVCCAHLFKLDRHQDESRYESATLPESRRTPRLPLIPMERPTDLAQELDVLAYGRRLVLRYNVAFSAELVALVSITLPTKIP